MNTNQDSKPSMRQLANQIKRWASELGFAECGITDTDLAMHESHLLDWLEKSFHGDMDYMQRHGVKRSRPGDLMEGTSRVISVSMNYFPPQARDAQEVLDDDQSAYISRYALGRDYHKVMRKRLQKLADKIQLCADQFSYRVFVDSAPVLEKALAEKSGLGWIGKHTNLLSERAGSWFFLGELYTDLPLPIDQAGEEHCGSCTQCIDICPTQAIVAPYKLDARRCISYLTIEMRGAIPEQYRKAIGNRIYGCDDCQLVCPWNKFSKVSDIADFAQRNNLDDIELVSLFAWSEEAFLSRMQGSAIRRIGYECWLRNIAVALGNATITEPVLHALNARKNDPSALVREHVDWALAQHEAF